MDSYLSSPWLALDQPVLLQWPLGLKTFAAHSIQLRQRNALNLDIDVLGKRLDRHTAAGWLVREPLGVLAVHVRKEAHVGQENVDLDHLGKL